jgi:hypothetical protein
LAPGREQSPGLAGLEYRLEEDLFGSAGQEPGSELGEDGEVEAGVGQFKPEQVFPVDAAANGIGGLSVGKSFGELEDQNQCESPGGLGGLTLGGEEVSEALIVVKGAELVAKENGGMTVREGGGGCVVVREQDRWPGA